MTSPLKDVAGVVSLVACLLATAAPAYAQSAPDLLSSSSAIPALSALSPESALQQPAAAAAGVETATPKPSPAFSALQVSFGALQVLDVVTTIRAVQTGRVEANPFMRDLSGHPAAFAAVKAGAAASTILLARKVAKNNRPAAIVLIAAVNSAYAAIVARNIYAAGRRR